MTDKEITHAARQICAKQAAKDNSDTHFDRLATLHTLREDLLDEALHIQQQEKGA